MCRIKGCAGKAVAKGLCSKHYMRVRRQASARKVGKSGRPHSPLLEYLRERERGLGEHSVPRTLARFAAWYRTRPEHAGLSDHEIVDRCKGTVAKFVMTQLEPPIRRTVDMGQKGQFDDFFVVHEGWVYAVCRECDQHKMKALGWEIYLKRTSQPNLSLMRWRPRGT